MPKKQTKSKQKQKQRQSVSQRQKVKVIVNLGKSMKRRQTKRQAKRNEIQQPNVNQIWTYQPQQLLPVPQYQQPVASQGTFVSAGQQQGQPLGGQSFTNINEQRQNALGGEPFQERESQPYSIATQFNQRQQPYLLDDVGYDEPGGQMVPYKKPPLRGRVDFEDDEPEGQMVQFQQPPSSPIIPNGNFEFLDTLFNQRQQTYLFDDPQPLENQLVVRARTIQDLSPFDISEASKFINQLFQQYMMPQNQNIIIEPRQPELRPNLPLVLRRNRIEPISQDQRLITDFFTTRNDGENLIIRPKGSTDITSDLTESSDQTLPPASGRLTITEGRRKRMSPEQKEQRRNELIDLVNERGYEPVTFMTAPNLKRYATAFGIKNANKKKKEELRTLLIDKLRNN
jgi:hypothetical protein